jgi:hypothetical protein
MLRVARTTGITIGTVLLYDYRATAKHIHNTGYIRYAARQLRSHVSAAFLVPIGAQKCPVNPI